MPKVGGFPKIDVPGQPRVPVLGAAPRYLQYLRDPVGVVLAVRPLGDLAAVADGDASFVCVFGEENVRQVLSDHATFRHDEDLIKAKPGSSMARLKTGIVGINGDLHRRHRRHLTPPFRASAMAAYAEQIVELTAQAVDRWPTSGTVDVDELTADLALRVALRCFFGLDVSDGVPLLGGVAAAWMASLSAPLSILVPLDLPGLPYRRTRRYTDEAVEQLDALIEQKRTEPPGTDALSQLVHDESPDRLEGDELIAAASAYFVAGHETTAKTLLWTLFLLDQHPAELDAVLDELSAVLGGQPPTPDDLPRLIQLDRVVKESMRVLTAVPLLFFRVPDRDVTVGGRRIPARSNLVISPLMEHRNPELFPEPLRFRPERWATVEPGLYQYLPFGAGPRVCIGAAFATQSIRLMLAMILQRRRFHGIEGTTINRLVRTNILMVKGGLPMAVGPADGPARRGPAVTGDITQLVDLP